MKIKLKTIRNLCILIAVFAAAYALSAKFFFRLDLTSEKRYSLSDNSKKLMKSLDRDLRVIIYLDGDLNPGFLRLKKATAELLDEFGVYAGKNLSCEFVNPSIASSKEKREQQYMQLMQRGLKPITIYDDKDEEGKAIQKVVFPWAEIIYGKDTVPVLLLQNNHRLSGADNLNNSVEGLEFTFTDALRVKMIKSPAKIAFLEGHGEFPPEYVYDATTAFGRYFSVHFGQLNNHIDELNGFKAIVIAGSQTSFSEQEKFIIDQYIMNGGRVLWLLDGVRMALDSLSSLGMSPAVPLNVNLDDMLFKYGVRIVPVILEDMQSVKVPVNVAQAGEAARFEPMPWYYSPLLLASPEHPISRNLVEVKAEFASALDLSVSPSESVRKIPLLVTSNATHVTTTPAIIDLNTMYDNDSKSYFTMGYIPVAAAFEGRFQSVFTNRLVPQGVMTDRKPLTQSKPTRMVVVADADIIRNDVSGYGENMQIIPLGFDRLTKQEYGNRSFILNSILYLTDDDGWLQLRSREFKLRLLNKKEVISSKRQWQIVNVALPLVVLVLFGIGYTLIRKRRYARK